MKNKLSRLLLTTLGILALASSILAQDQAPDPAAPVAAPAPAIDYDSITAKDGATYGIAAGQELIITNEVKLATIITVATNGTFKVGDGAVRTLKPGQILGKDARLTDVDGSLTPVQDHVVKKNNAVMLVKDGVAAPLGSPLTLGDGSIVGIDGYLMKNGKRQFIVEGQILELSGAKIQAVDTATLIGGQVVIQKDGQSYKLSGKSSITMNDGTRIYGDGRVVKFGGGGESRLQEGQVLRIEGVATK